MNAFIHFRCNNEGVVLCVDAYVRGHDECEEGVTEGGVGDAVGGQVLHPVRVELLQDQFGHTRIRLFLCHEVQTQAVQTNNTQQMRDEWLNVVGTYTQWI